MEPEPEPSTTCNNRNNSNNSTTAATSSAFHNLDIVNGDIVNIHNEHRSPVETYNIGFPDMLPPSREASTSSEPNGDHQASTTTPQTTTKLDALLDQTTANTSELNDATISKQPPKEEDTSTAIFEGETRIIAACSLRELVQMGVSKRTDFPLRNSRTALLIIDVQTYCCDGVDVAYYQETSRPLMLSNIQSLLQSFRKHRDATTNTTISGGCEVIFTMIQSQTKDGRDSSLDYKLSGPYFERLPKVDATFQELFLPSIMPSTTVGRGDIVIPKTACSVFTSTNLDYVLRNLHVEQLVVCGQLTEQCVESAVRDAADLGYFVTLVEDACATYSLERHEQGLSGMKGFCRIVSTQQVLEELSSQETPADPPKSSLSSAVEASVPMTASEATSSASQPAPTTPTKSSSTAALHRRIPRAQPPTPRHLEDGCGKAILKSLHFAGIKFLRYLSVNASGLLQCHVAPIDVFRQQGGSLNYPFDDFIFHPDPASLQFLPYAPKTAMMFGSLYEQDDSTPSSRCTRHLLERIVQQGLEAHDLCFQLCVELFFTLCDAATGNPVDDYTGTSASAKRLIEQEAFASALYDQLKEQEINVTGVNAGNDPGQLVVVLGTQDPVRLADQVVAAQETIGAVSHSYSQKAAFRSNELNLFLSFSTLARDDNPRELSSTGEHFLAGIMHRAEALSAISLGACRTLRHKKEFGWSSRRKDNAILRVFPNGLSQDLHIEYRLCDSSCNMYLTLAALLATGIHGMEQQLTLESPYYEKDEKLFDTASLTERLEQDDFLMQTLGSALGKDYLSFLQQEANHDDDKM